MESWRWVAENVFELLSAIGIIGGLVFTAISLRSEAKTRRVSNLLALTENHRELWKAFYHNVELNRILDPSADIATLPVNRGEEVFVTVVIQHLASVYRAMRNDLTIEPEGVRRDVRTFFKLPLARFVWEKIGALQDKDFVHFVEGCVAEKVE